MHPQLLAVGVFLVPVRTRQQDPGTAPRSRHFFMPRYRILHPTLHSARYGLPQQVTAFVRAHAGC